MSDAWVGVVGTLLGAALGAAVALIAEELRARREKASRFTLERHKLYKTYMAALLEWDALVAAAGREADRDPTRAALSPKLRAKISAGWDLLTDTYADLMLLAGPRVLGVVVDQSSVFMGAAGSGLEDFRAMVGRFRGAEASLAALQSKFVTAVRDELGTNIGG
jgi:hypothetical protein